MSRSEDFHHEVSYHITDNPHFKLDPTYRPEDNTFSLSAAANGGRAPEGVFVSKHPEAWVNGHGYVRPYVAEIQHPPLKSFGGYSGENFIPAKHFDQAKVSRVIPLDAHAREEYGGAGWIESHHGTAFDTGKPLPAQDWHAYPGYRYPGPDVREMAPEEHAKHQQRWIDYMTGNRGWSHEDAENLRRQ